LASICLNKFATKQHQAHQYLLKNIGIMLCEIQHTMCQRQLRHVGLNTIIVTNILKIKHRGESADKQRNTKTLQEMFKMSASLWNARPQPNSPLINDRLLDASPTVNETSLQLIDISHRLLIDPLL